MNQDQHIRQQAAHWLAGLHSGQASAETEAAFLRWQAEDPRHAEAIERLRARLGDLQRSPLQQLGEERLARTLEAPSRRRFLRGGLAVGGLATGALLLGRFSGMLPSSPQALRTDIGQRRDFALADGSRLTLNASSRVTVQGPRTLHLQQGELILEVQGSQQGAFALETAGGRLESASGRLLCRLEQGTDYLLALQSTLTFTERGGQRHLLQPGQWLRRFQDGAVVLGEQKGTETLWLKGLLDVDNLPLAEVIERLRPYHHGSLGLSPAIASLHVSGVLPLDDSRHALEMLAGTLPIRIVQAGPDAVVLEPA